MRPSIRFEVFKRDGFKCQYCGRTPDGVVLEVDHIHPLAEGGTDDIENLVTACWDCNRGKGAKTLDSRAPVRDLVETAEVLREREAQLRAFHEASESLRKFEEQHFNQVRNHWFLMWDAEELDRWQLPRDGDFKRYIASVGVAETLDAVEITREKFDRRYPNMDSVKYFIGVCKGKEAQVEGRKHVCPECGKWMTLTREEKNSQPDDATWYHGECHAKKLERAESEALERELAEDSERVRQENLAAAHEKWQRAVDLELVEEIDLEVQAWDNLAKAAGF